MDSTPGSQKIALVMVIALIASGFYVFIWEPIHSRTEMLRSEVQHLRQEIQHYKTANLDPKALEAKIKNIATRLYGGYQIFQEEIGMRGLRNRVTGIAHDYQLEITYWQPEVFVEGSPDGIKKTRIRVQIEGGYHQVAKFFTRLLHLPDIFGISQFTIGVTGDQTENFHLQTNFVMTRLSPPLPEEVPKVLRQLSNEDDQAPGI